MEWCTLIGLDLVPVLYMGPWDEDLIRGLSLDLERQEGYVIRAAASFGHEDFGDHVAKWVRKGHVQTGDHWMFQEIVPNELGEG